MVFKRSFIERCNIGETKENLYARNDKDFALSLFLSHDMRERKNDCFEARLEVLVVFLRAQICVRARLREEKMRNLTRERERRETESE